MPKYTIGIAVYEKENNLYLKNCLKSIEDTTDDYEVFVIETKFPRKSVGIAWDEAIRKGTGGVCAVINDDGLFSDNLLDNLSNHLSNKAIGIVSPTISICANNQKDVFNKVNSVLLNQTIDSFSQKDVNSFSRIFKNMESVQTSFQNNLCGACLVFSRETFEAVGGFDDFFPAYGEDDFFCYKVQKGLKKHLCYDPKSYFHHFGRKTSERMSDIDRLYTSQLLKEKIKEFDELGLEKWLIKSKQK